MGSDAVSTPLSGPRVAIRFPDEATWEIKICPQIRGLSAAARVHTLDVQVGPVRIRLVTDDDHLRDCLQRSFPGAGGGGEPAGIAHLVTALPDERALKGMLQIDSEQALTEEIAWHQREAMDPYFRLGLPEDLPDLSALMHPEKTDRALRRPIAFYRPEERTLVIVNDNDYGEVRARGVLGLAEACLTGQIEIDDEKKVLNPDESWLLLQGAAGTLPGRGGAVFIGPEGSGRGRVAQGLHQWKGSTPFLPSAAVLVRLGDGRMAFPETSSYLRTDMAPHFPDLAGQITRGTVENSAGRGRALVDPALFGGGKSFSEETSISDLVVVRRDYGDTRLVKEITFKEAMGALTSADNAPVYDPDETDVEGYLALKGMRWEPYFNSCILQAKIELDRGRFGELDRKRLASLLHLAREGGLRFLWVNPRLPFPQIQYCLRKFLAGECERADLLKARDTPDDLVWSLGLKKQSKPPAEGRREVDRLGLFREKIEADVVAFFKGGAISELIAVERGREGKEQVMAYSKAAVDYFFKSGDHLGVADLFS